MFVDTNRKTKDPALNDNLHLLLLHCM